VVMPETSDPDVNVYDMRLIRHADGSVDAAEPKVSAWKGPYHSVRMCLEMMRRLGDGIGAAT